MITNKKGIVKGFFPLFKSKIMGCISYLQKALSFWLYSKSRYTQVQSPLKEILPHVKAQAAILEVAGGNAHRL